MPYIEMQTSPVIKKPSQVQIDFIQAVKELIDGKKVTKLEWNNPNIYFFIQDEYLRIMGADGQTHNTILRLPDLIGTDFIVVE